MTDVIINDIRPLTQTIATAGQTIYSTNWTANYPSDVIVYSRPANTPADDATQILVYPNLYSVSFIGGLQTVQVTLVNPSNMGDVVTITRQTPADRENLYTNTNFTPSMLNNDFGILTLVDQQAQLVNQQIGPRYNYSAFIQNIVDTILPILQPNQVWVKNPDNTAIIAASFNTFSGGVVNLGTTGQIAYYPANGNTLSGVTPIGAGVPALLTEGTFVPVLISSGGGTATYTLQTGNYSVIGNRFFYDLSLQLATSSLNPGTLTISGFPYNAQDYNGVAIYPGLLANTAITSITAYIASSGDNITLYKYAAGIDTQLTVADITSNAQFFCSGSYLIL